MTIIKVTYDDGSNSLVKVHRQAKKSGKRLCEMTTLEITGSLFGQYR